MPLTTKHPDTPKQDPHSATTRSPLSLLTDTLEPWLWALLLILALGLLWKIGHILELELVHHAHRLGMTLQHGTFHLAPRMAPTTAGLG